MTLKDWAAVVQSIVTSLGIVAAGLWAYFNYFKGRTHKSRLKLTVNGELVPVDDSFALVARCYAENTGLSKVPIEQEGTALRFLGYRRGAAEDFDESNCHHFITSDVFAAHSWIEPGEIVHDEFFFPMGPGPWIAARLELRLVSVRSEWMSLLSKRREWNEVGTIVKKGDEDVGNRTGSTGSSNNPLADGYGWRKRG